MQIRVNCVDPSILSKNHLYQEFLVIPRVFDLVQDYIASCSKRLQNNSEVSLPCSTKCQCVIWLRATNRRYRHDNLKFMYTKCLYLKKRYVELYKEMHRRGMKPKIGVLKVNLLRAKHINKDFCADWNPGLQDWEENLKILKLENSKHYMQY